MNFSCPGLNQTQPPPPPCQHPSLSPPVLDLESTIMEAEQPQHYEQEVIPPPAPRPPPPRPPPPGNDTVAHNTEQTQDWPMVLVAFCLASAVEIALCWVQNSGRLPLLFHFLSFFILLAFTSLLVARFVASKYPIQSQALDRVGVFCVATAFFFAVTIPFPLCLKLTSWAIYALSLLVIVYCNNKGTRHVKLL
ncbi:unnamed protein product [Ilex paraguariensis]|uniref:Uncharacterized protein n=1 Tax=Ilex paraguariensis TaxID=185542 RepID=A0ABC8RSC3_9AQUA